MSEETYDEWIQKIKAAGTHKSVAGKICDKCGNTIQNAGYGCRGYHFNPPEKDKHKYDWYYCVDCWKPKVL